MKTNDINRMIDEMSSMKDEIIKMAREAQQESFVGDMGHWFKMEAKDLERFFHMAQAAEREACLQIVDDFVDVPYLEPTIKAIRARGQA